MLDAVDVFLRLLAAQSWPAKGGLLVLWGDLSGNGELRFDAVVGGAQIAAGKVRDSEISKAGNGRRRKDDHAETSRVCDLPHHAT